MPPLAKNSDVDQPAAPYASATGNAPAQAGGGSCSKPHRIADEPLEERPSPNSSHVFAPDGPNRFLASIYNYGDHAFALLVSPCIYAFSRSWRLLEGRAPASPPVHPGSQPNPNRLTPQ